MSVFKDVATMLNAGFTAAEIKDMIKLDRDAKKEDDTKVFETEKPAPTEKPATKTEITKEEKPADDKDYKALYEATKKDLESLQQKNTQENIKPADVDRDALFKNIKTSIC